MPDAYLDALNVADFRDRWVQRLTSPPLGSEVLVAQEGDQILGFAGYGAARHEESGDDGELHALNVEPTAWERGVGSKLLSAAHQRLKEIGHATATLWVVTGNNRARRFYERHHWTFDNARRSDERHGVHIEEVRYFRQLDGV